MSTAAVPGAADGPYTVYTGRVTNWSMVTVSAVALLAELGLGLGSRGSWPDLAGPALLVGIGVVANVLTGASVRTTARPRGVKVHLGVLGWPRRIYPPDRIVRAAVTDVSAWQVVGGVWWTPRRTSWTVRRGPALRLTLRNGRRVSVSTPDPRAAAATLHEAITG